MRKEDIDQELKELAFDFFYWFSRFEFALKENRVLKNAQSGVNAEPGWEKFVDNYANQFTHSDETRRLLELNPKRQIVGVSSDLVWTEVGLDDCRNELCKVVRLLKTIRNNLFHGGKHGAEGWDDIGRNRELLAVGKAILDQLAREAVFEADYTQHY